jgi:hypothetical protein
VTPERLKEIRERLEYLANNKSWGIDYDIGTDLLAALDSERQTVAKLREVLCEEIHRCNNTHLGSGCGSCTRMQTALKEIEDGNR